MNEKLNVIKYLIISCLKIKEFFLFNFYNVIRIKSKIKMYFRFESR